MSFSSTPLGQGRRLDHNTFLNKPPSNGNRPPSPLSIPTSYSYGAPTAATRSPPKPQPASRDGPASFSDEDDQNDSALTRFARLKQREQATLVSRPGGPKIITSPPRPEKWSVKDTSVNIATAFTQAAADMQPSSNPNNAWASGSSRPNPAVPRSTSVEYERDAQATLARRLPGPPSKAGPPRSMTGRRQLAKTTSAGHVSDSEEDIDRPPVNGRGKTPLQDIVDTAKRALIPATYYLQQKFGDTSIESPSANGTDSSYNYSREEEEFQASQHQKQNAKPTIHKRNRIPNDNKAYRPSLSDSDSTGPDSDDERGKRSRKKGGTKGTTGGPLTGLPVISQDRRRKKKSKGNKHNVEGEENRSESEEYTDRQSVQQQASISRNSVPPSSRHSVPRGSAPPEPLKYNDPETSIDIEQALDSIPEVNEDDVETPDTSYEQQQQHENKQQTQHPPPSRIGGPIGSVVYFVVRISRAIVLFFVNILITMLYAFGRVFGTIFGTIWMRPVEWITGPSPSAHLLLVLLKYAGIALILWGTWYNLQEPLKQRILRWPSQPTFNPPSAPAANIAELSARLQKIEAAIASIASEAERGRTKADNEAKTRSELVGRVGVLEGRMSAESRRVSEAETQIRNVAKEGLRAVKHEVEVLQAQIQTQYDHHQGKGVEYTYDEEARARLRDLEERVGTVEGGVKDALEVGKKSALGVAPSTGPAWWNKVINTPNSGMTIKSTDGQDVTGLIKHLVDSAMSTYSKDILARPDFALHSGGARVIPSLTSPTFEIKPSGLRGQLVGLATGIGYMVGRSPVTALHHDVNNGLCWPMAGSQGQLGIALAAPAYISDVTIDHVPPELAFDMSFMRSAPREMELWGMVEGKDNIAKVRQWMVDKQQRRQEAKENGESVEEEEEYPKSLPRSPQYVRVANFTYDIYAPNHIQTFSVRQEIRDLGVDFGIVVLRVKSNWGRDEYTCLYRLRVHGQRMGEVVLPHPAEVTP